MKPIRAKSIPGSAARAAFPRKLRRGSIVRAARAGRPGTRLIMAKGGAGNESARDATDQGEINPTFCSAGGVSAETAPRLT